MTRDSKGIRDPKWCLVTKRGPGTTIKDPIKHLGGVQQAIEKAPSSQMPKALTGPPVPDGPPTEANMESWRQWGHQWSGADGNQHAPNNKSNEAQGVPGTGYRAGYQVQWVQWVQHGIQKGSQVPQRNQTDSKTDSKEPHGP